MNEITPGDVRKWQNEMVAFRYKNGKSYFQTYKKTMHNILSAIFNHACRFYNLKSNPARQAGNMGREEKKEMLFWTTEEYKKFSEVVIDKPVSFYAFEMLYWTGMRLGELLALTMEDFDFEKKDKKPDIDDSIPSALMVDEPKTIETVPAAVVEEKPKNTPAPSKNQEKSSPQNNKKDNAQPKNKSADMPAAQAMPIKESHTPVLDVLNQKGFDVIPSAIIKNTTIDYIGVSKNQLFLCLIDKEAGDWLADEEKFNDEEPLWFSESSHRISPVRKIDVARDILKTKLAVGDMNFEIIAYVIIQAGNIINAEDMFEIWNNMNVNVTRINRGSPKEIRLFSKSLDNCEEKTDKNTLEKLKKLIRSLA